MAGTRLNRVARDMAVEQSLDAAIELDEVIAGLRADAPTLVRLATTLVGSQPDVGVEKKDLLKDSQSASLYHRAASTAIKDTGRSNLDEALDLFRKISSIGLSEFSQDSLDFIRRFCLGLNQELVSEAFDRLPHSPSGRDDRQKSAFANGY